MNNYVFSEASEENLKLVHPELVKVLRYALEISPIDFGISCGVRDYEDQVKRVADGDSETLDSYHLIQKKTGYSHAVDIMVFPNGKLSWEPIDFSPVLQAIMESAILFGVQIEFGAFWQSLVDCPHIQLNQSYYKRR